MLVALAEDVAATRLTKREWDVMRPVVVKRIDVAKAVVMADRYKRAVQELVGQPDVLATQWDQLSLSRRRSTIRGLIDHIVIGPAIVGQLFVNPRRVSIAWHGDPPFELTRKVLIPAKSRCSIVGCRRVSKARSYCQMHYVRSRTTGSPGGVRPQYGHWYIGKACKLDGCTEISASLGLCQKHYDTWIHETAGLTRCAAWECVRPATIANLCTNHHQQARRRENERIPNSQNVRAFHACKVADCVHPTRRGGYCLARYHQWLAETADKPRCQSVGCERPAEVFGICGKHDAYFRYQRVHHPERVVESGCRSRGQGSSAQPASRVRPASEPRCSNNR